MVVIEGIDYEVRYEYLLLNLCKKRKGIEEFEEKCLFFEN